MKSINLQFWFLIGSAALGFGFQPALAGEPVVWPLRASVLVDATGVYLDQLVVTPESELPHLLLAAAPAAGQMLLWNRAQLVELLSQRAPDLATTNWSGANQIKISRRTRSLDETELKTWLTATLQREFIKEKGELELRFTRPWPTLAVVDEPLTLKIVDLPSTGVTPNCIVRFEILEGSSAIGNWQMPVQARVWRDVWVAGAPLQRGQLVREAELIKERRDLLTVRDGLTSVTLDNPSLEFAENVPAGTALTARSLRLRPVVRRGQVADAMVQDGALVISAKVEILEDGLPGQTVRVRNLKSKREFRGKVQNEDTIIVTL